MAASVSIPEPSPLSIALYTDTTRKLGRSDIAEEYDSLFAKMYPDLVSEKEALLSEWSGSKSH